MDPEKAFGDKSEACELMSGLKVHEKNKIFIDSDNELRKCTLLVSDHATLCSWFFMQVASEIAKH